MFRLMLMLVLVLSVAASVSAQTATLSGMVVDPSGAALPGAEVQLTGPASQSTTSGPRGDYRFRNLPNGTFQVTVKLSGFAITIRNDVTVAGTSVEVPAITLPLATLNDVVVVTATKAESALLDAPVTMSVITSDTLATTPTTNYADLLRSVPGMNAIQTSARDFNLTSRQSTSTLSNSQLVLIDGRSVYLDFFGLVLWDFLPTNFGDIKQIEVVRGPASAVWGANALTGVVNIITKSPREAPGTTVSLSGGFFGRDTGSGVNDDAGGIFGASVRTAQIVNDRWSYKASAGYFASDHLPRPAGRVPVITDPRDPSAIVGGALYPVDADGAPGTAFVNKGTRQPKFDIQVDQEVARGRMTYAAGIVGSEGIIHTGIGPFAIQRGSVNGYGKVGYRRDALKVDFFTNLIDAEAPNLLLADPSTNRPIQLNFKTQTYDVEVGDSWHLGQRHLFTYGGNVRRNNFDISIAPSAENRTELGAYVQDEIFVDRVPLHGGRPRRQVRQPERPGVFAEAGRGLQGHARPRPARLVQSGVPIAVRHQQLPGHAYRGADRLERPGATLAAAAAAARGGALSARCPGGR